MSTRPAAKTPQTTTTAPAPTAAPQTTTTQPTPVVVAPGATAAEPATPPGTPSAAVDPREAALADLINVTPTDAATLDAAAAALAVPVVPTGLVHQWEPAGARYLVRCSTYPRNVTRPDPNDHNNKPPRLVTQRLEAHRGDIVILVPDDRTHGHVDLGYLLPAEE